MNNDITAENRQHILNALMRSMRPDWRDRWCEPGPEGCGCMGCANVSGGLSRSGFTKEEWVQWQKEVFNRC